MSADVAPAILSYLSDNTYPDSESISTATLDSASLSQLLEALRKEQETAKASVRDLSRSIAPDIDTWISRAKTLEVDIQRSRETARQIVADAEAGKTIRAEVEDKAKKLDLLEREVEFNESLTGTLEHVRYASGLLDKAREAAVAANIESCLETLEDAEASISGMSGVAGPRTIDALRDRMEQLRAGTKETVTECWDGLIHINIEDRIVKITKYIDTPLGDELKLDLDSLVVGARGLDIFDGLIQKLAKDIERAILRPRLTVDENDQVAELAIRNGKLSCAGKSGNLSTKALFEDLRKTVDFLSSHLSPAVAIPLSADLIPALVSRLERHWLDPAIPLSMQDIPDFQILLEDVSELADHIEQLGWSGTDALQTWTQNAPRAWLTKRREVVLGDVRNLVFEGLRERKVVERVETRMVNREDVGLGTGTDGGEDDWDVAWDEPEEQPAAAKGQITQETDELDEEASAWELDADDDDNASSKKDEGEGETEAWGWGDEEQQPSSPVASRKQPTGTVSGAKPHGEPNKEAEQELTLRETFTVSAIPEGLLTILKQTVTDAQTLSGPEYASSPIAPAATALYTLPTLALAIYRATAFTAYSKIDDGTGNMLLYNDASRLSDQLREWQGSQPAHSRLKVDNDVQALEVFAKRAYSSEMDSQRTIINDLLDGAQGFANCTQHPFKLECESAVDATVDRLRDVHKVWKGLLSQGALLQSLGSLLSSVTGKIISEIEDLGDISDPESKQLKLLCDKVLEIRDVFIQQRPGSSTSMAGVDGGEEDSAAGQDMTFIYSPTWLKFQYLTELLESSLADIKWMWEEGGLALEFGPEEVVELVEALFEDSERRRSLVRTMRGRG